jgi:hypothetical protein
MSPFVGKKWKRRRKITFTRIHTKQGTDYLYFIKTKDMSVQVTPQIFCEKVFRSFNADIYRLFGGYLTKEDFQAFLGTNKCVCDEYIGYRYILRECKLP